MGLPKNLRAAIKGPNIIWMAGSPSDFAGTNYPHSLNQELQEMLNQRFGVGGVLLMHCPKYEDLKVRSREPGIPLSLMVVIERASDLWSFERESESAFTTSGVVFAVSSGSEEAEKAIASYHERAAEEVREAQEAMARGWRQHFEDNRGNELIVISKNDPKLPGLFAEKLAEAVERNKDVSYAPREERLGIKTRSVWGSEPTIPGGRLL